MNKIGKIILFFFELQHNIKLYHWQTKSFARHKATDQLGANLSDLIDSFVEVYIGRYSRPMYQKPRNIVVSNWNDETAVERITEAIRFLEIDIQEHLEEKDTDLLNIRDEMLSILNTTLYLFTLD